MADLPHRRTQLESWYRQVNRRRYVQPDPLAYLYDYPDVRDREIVALIAASLAYGRVQQIMISVGQVLQQLKPSPRQFVINTSTVRLRAALDGFYHRFATASHMVSLIQGVRSALETHGTLHAAFAAGYREDHDTVMPALAAWIRKLRSDTAGNPGHLIADPEKNSACKRLHLFLRWMVRRDAVDPGGWPGINPAKLIVPLDVHMFAIGHHLGFTRRKTPDGRAALEVTRGFRTICPEDPVRYDFCLTRFGIRDDMTLDSFLSGLSSADDSAKST